MKSLEIIHLRLGAEPPLELIEQIQSFSEPGQSPSHLSLFQRKGLAADLSIHIVHDMDEEELPGPLGVFLAAALGEHGMVEHSVWVEVKREKR